MEPRIEQELNLLRAAYPAAEFLDGWIKVPDYPLPPGWSAAATDVAFYVRDGYPGTHLYGIYVPAGLTYQRQPPNNYTCPASPPPPFPGTWGVFSWEPDENWCPTADPANGHNFLTWVAGFKKRFQEGR
jgi:hypothetical protein